MPNKTIIDGLLKRIGLILLVCGLTGSVQAQETFIDLKMLQQRQLLEPRPALVLITAPWCRLCAAMKHNFLANKERQKSLLGSVYLSLLDAEDTRDILFYGKLYSFKASGKLAGVHELAIEWTEKDEPVTYPTLVVLNAQGTLLARYAGYLTPPQLTAILSALN